jgi:hypothetical protein
MRFELRLHGSTRRGQRCAADVSVYANNHESFQWQVREAGTSCPLSTDDEAFTPIPENATIIVERALLKNDK